MILISLDVYNNKIVRLIKGKLNNIYYFGYLKEYINFYYSINIKKIHLITLDNIFKNNKKLIKIKKKIKIQFGGGFNNINIINNYYNYKKSDFVLGSVLFKNKKEFKKILSYYKNKILISLDCNENIIYINGWKTKTFLIFDKIFYYLIDLNIKKIIYTDISKDGTLVGFEKSNLFFLNNKLNLCKIIISGGVKNLENLKKIENNFNFIIGISIYKFYIKLKEII
ncbi:phosphoribosylformimino-5-aminoimidazole carboxamide ribonucleotide (ProFAR) isomerase [Candidatus Carsonella ruddii CS isolate Thao2000]|uniref:Phosphoribosylformimino-5-aminoimidazole carboxamide ribonucleotide (ProFAR) isomerase n=1 Tax=Candidatus Carsonella ruddii CS isolate Thao2000 TaxID=1202537 RepID=J7GT89_CARRU|nr:HisA/HisF-related TIM barrel protein [Candidatus Carsonella ruddii]AFP83734.1 phosphoribosylformimino-5-aminoimidazole carboxamide ribonucleotide (ProFAR) isomerase [Candidatus Carsonella ruddii CS isolate Thao2000]